MLEKGLAKTTNRVDGLACQGKKRKKKKKKKKRDSSSSVLLQLPECILVEDSLGWPRVADHLSGKIGFVFGFCFVSLLDI